MLLSIAFIIISGFSSLLSIDQQTLAFFLKVFTGTLFFVGILGLAESINTVTNNFIYKHKIEDAFFVTFFPSDNPDSGNKFVGRLPNGKIVFPHKNYKVGLGTWLVKIHKDNVSFSIVVPVREENAYEKMIR